MHFNIEIYFFKHIEADKIKIYIVACYNSFILYSCKRTLDIKLEIISFIFQVKLTIMKVLDIMYYHLDLDIEKKT